MNNLKVTDIEVKNAFGCALRKIRKEKKLTQVQIAKKLKKTQAQFSAYETGVSDIALTDFFAIAKILNIHPDLLFMEVYSNCINCSKK